MNIETLIITIVLGVLVLTLLEGIVAILRRIVPALDTWWLVFLAWGLGIVLAWALAINVLAPWVANAAAGYVLTGLIIGGMAMVIRWPFNRG